MSNPRNNADANKLATIIALICTKRSPDYKIMIMSYETGEYELRNDGMYPVIRSISTPHLAELCEHVQQMDSELLAAVKHGVQEAIANYLYGMNK